MISPVITRRARRANSRSTDTYQEDYKVCLSRSHLGLGRTGGVSRVSDDAVGRILCVGNLLVEVIKTHRIDAICEYGSTQIHPRS